MRKEAILMIKTLTSKARGQNPGHVIKPVHPVSMHVNPTWLQARPTQNISSNNNKTI